VPFFVETSISHQVAYFHRHMANRIKLDAIEIGRMTLSIPKFATQPTVREALRHSGTWIHIKGKRSLILAKGKGPGFVHPITYAA
jgi:hypothetical protein